MAKTKYKSKYCEEVVEYFKRFLDMRDDPIIDDRAELVGMVPVHIENGEAQVQARACSGYPSLVKFALKIGVNERTLTNWRASYPDFDDACKFADLIQDEVLNERGLMGTVDGRVAMKIRELKQNARKNGEEDGGGAKLVVNFGSDSNEQKIEIKKYVGEINEDVEY